MVIYEESLDAIFSALADPTRRSIVARLASGEATVMEIAAPLSMSQPAVSRHLKVLEKAGLISRSKRAQQRPCRLEGENLRQINLWLERYRTIWEMQFNQLDTLLEELQRGAGIAPEPRRSGPTVARKKAETRNANSPPERDSQRGKGSAGSKKSALGSGAAVAARAKPAKKTRKKRKT
ncbi:MAG: helix-turn-helix transcriptional regulator [Leptospiraceae bacterium]|nr:helix-turn-helix transcriptional regulator [Leptospiraceae bacterium]